MIRVNNFFHEFIVASLNVLLNLMKKERRV